MPGIGLLSAQHDVVLALYPHEQLLHGYRRQFPKFMESLADPDHIPYIPTHHTKRFEDLTDDDLKTMYIPGHYKYMI